MIKKLTFALIFIALFQAVLIAQDRDDISRFLQPNHFIDSDNPIMIAKAKEITKGCTTEAEKARVLFEFVKYVDELPEHAPSLSTVPFLNDEIGYTVRYYKGSLMLDYFRNLLGDEEFFKICHDFYQKFNQTVIGTAEFHSFWEGKLGEHNKELNIWLDSKGGVQKQENEIKEYTWKIIAMDDKTEKIWEKFHNILKRFVLKKVLHEDVAEDILQDVFIKIHSHIDTLKDESKLQSWIFQITRNTIADYYRSQKSEEELSNTIEVTEDSSDEDANEIDQCIETLLDYLPENYREALYLAEYKGLTQKELAKKFGISLSGAKSRVQRARKKLKNMLMECCHDQLGKRGIAIAYRAECECCCEKK